MLRARSLRFSVLLVLAGFASAGVARTVTEIIYAPNTLNLPFHIAADDSGNAYITGVSSDNVFKIELCDPWMTIPYSKAA